MPLSLEIAFRCQTMVRKLYSWATTRSIGALEVQPAMSGLQRIEVAVTQSRSRASLERRNFPPSHTGGAPATALTRVGARPCHVRPAVAADRPIMVAKEAFALLGYATCSSLMLVMNKVAVHVLPAPSFVLLMQFLASWLVVKVCGLCGCIVVDELECNKLRQFFFVSLAFLACVYANIKTLQFANVETFVVFRASTPIVISLCDWLFLGRELPDRRSACALVGLLGMVAGYIATDAHFVVHGYAWVAVWYVIFCFDQVRSGAVSSRHSAGSRVGTPASTKCPSSTLLTTCCY